MLLLGGGVLLYFGAEWLVGGASGLARSLGVPQLLIGLTVVAYGTSAPEVVVGVKASLAGAGGIALGNVIGSNIANLGLILGVTALVKPARVDGALIRREVPVLVLATLAVPLVLLDGRVTRLEGAVLLLFAAGYSVWMVVSSRRSMAGVSRDAGQMEKAADLAGAPSPRGKGRLALTALAGLGLLVLGGSLFVDGASGLARGLGISERIIGLTIVAVGTSLPELATSLIAAWRGHSDISVGNVVGSNIFNSLLCLGAAALIAPIEAPLQSVRVDLAVMVVLTLLGAFVMRTSRVIGRVEGGLFVLAYAGFLLALALT
ncbi:MAG: calcium/sodium antiporter [Archangium sp.]|nr:calcium/sodium antiporter [Archangium sp.]MDP3156683.1 calcium/sodium antiporter [Archangium sp.]MDP3570624.1 calcium/sodium antiporter [Archangium sp.]